MMVNWVSDMRYLLLHDGKSEDQVKSFFTEVHELYLKVSWKLSYLPIRSCPLTIADTLTPRTCRSSDKSHRFSSIPSTTPMIRSNQLYTSPYTSATTLTCSSSAGVRSACENGCPQVPLMLKIFELSLACMPTVFELLAGRRGGGTACQEEAGLVAPGSFPLLSAHSFVLHLAFDVELQQQDGAGMAWRVDGDERRGGAPGCGGGCPEGRRGGSRVGRSG
eukprot:494314-Hanusia_phi.AAC.1